MKLKFSHQNGSKGSVLILALVISGILGIGVGSYLTLVGAQARSVGRSQDWNRALAVAEAGVEEALAQLNPGVSGSSVNLTANGWGTASGGFYGPRSRTISADNYSVVYTSDVSPVIYSTGLVTSASSTLMRVIQVRTQKTPLFSAGLATKLNIDFRGNGVETDSFDSGNTNLSASGQYSSGKTSTNGDIASIAGLVNVGNATVNGDIYLGPSASSFVNNGTVSGTVYHDFNADFPDVVLPIPVSSFVSAPPGTTNLNGTTYGYCFTISGNYIVNSSANIYVGPGANVRVYVTTSISPDSIRIDGSGANAGNLQLYMAGASFELTGRATIESGLASKFTYWGMPSNTTIKLSGNSAFTGSIYAPSADFILGGGGNNGYDFVGASVTKSATITGHYKFHFDEALAKTGPTKAYLGANWKEL